VEQGSARHVFRRPMHPYTAALLACRPRLGQTGRLPSIDGTVPEATRFPAGCRFQERCSWRSDRCLREPALEEVDPGRWVACWHWDQVRKSPAPAASAGD
jgi:oligopeptide/dipeptide ABC transporter ATP-binding protein